MDHQEELKSFVTGAIEQMSDEEYKRFQDNLSKAPESKTSIPKLISDLKEDQFDYIDEYQDIDPEVENLLIENDKGEVVWHIKGRDQIKEFLDERRKTMNRIKLENKIKGMRLCRKEKALIKQYIDKLEKDGTITKLPITTPTESDKQEPPKKDG